MDRKNDVAEKQPPVAGFRLVSIGIAVAMIVVAFHLMQQAGMMAFVQLFLHVPAVFVSLRYSSFWAGVVTIVASTAVIAVWTGFEAGVLFFLGTGVIALILMGCFLRKYSATATISWLVVYYVLFGVLVLYFQENMSFEVYTQQVMTILEEQFANIYQNQQLPWQQFEHEFQGFIRVASITFPLITTVVFAAIMYIVTRTMLRIQKISLPPLACFQDWHLSEYLVWVVILGGGLYHLEYTRLIGINVLLGLVFLYYVQGCAVITFFLKQKRIGRFFHVVAYILLFLQIPYIFVGLGLLLTGYAKGSVYFSLPAIVVVAGLGLANVWVDFRKRIRLANL